MGRSNAPGWKGESTLLRVQETSTEAVNLADFLCGVLMSASWSGVSETALWVLLRGNAASAPGDAQQVRATSLTVRRRELW